MTAPARVEAATGLDQVDAELLPEIGHLDDAANDGGSGDDRDVAALSPTPIALLADPRTDPKWLIGNLVRPVLDPLVHVRNHRSLRRLAEVVAESDVETMP